VDPELRSILVCPLCHHELLWSKEEIVAGDLRTAWAACPSCGIRSAVHEGVGFFLPGDAPEHLPDPRPPEPADESLFLPGPEPALAERAISTFSSVRGRLLELEPRHPAMPLTSSGGGAPRRLLGSSDPDRIRTFQAEIGAAGGWDALCFEIHSMPFKDRSLVGALADATLQTTAGPLVILRELRRIVSGPLVVPVAFVDPLAEPDQAWLTARGWGEMFQEPRLLEMFRRARWRARFEPFGTRTLAADPGRGFPSRPTAARVGLIIAE
jgi:hypothetical protein